MRAQIEIQAVWNQNKGVVQLFIGDFIVSMPPDDCAALEPDLASARTMPERAVAMVLYSPYARTTPEPAAAMTGQDVDGKLPHHAPWPPMETVFDIIKREVKERKFEAIARDQYRSSPAFARAAPFIPEPCG